MSGELACCGTSKKVDAITDSWKILLDAAVFSYILTPIISAVVPDVFIKTDNELDISL